jgi:glucose-1-phosphate cytidylyltransferase
MKVVILAGGMGTRLSEETEAKPKPMVEVGGRPVLWHIMKHYAYHGFREFCIALGYRGEAIKRYFLDYYGLSGNVTVDLATGGAHVQQRQCEDWRVHLIDTGLATNTGGRLKRLEEWLRDETFLLTYGDGLTDVNPRQVLTFHRGHGRLATVTAVRPPARFGGLIFDGDLVAEFTEKPQVGEGWINGGFMVMEPGVLEYLAGDATSLEADGLEKLSIDRQLAAYRHEGFWQCMDTLRDVRVLERLWQSGTAPWKVWE